MSRETRLQGKLVVLFLASWYPNRVEPLNGIFIQRHAESIARFCKVAVVCAIPDNHLMTGTYDVVSSPGEDILTVRVYYQPKFRGHRISGLNLARYVRACFIGYRQAKRLLGRPNIIHVNVGYPCGLVALLLKAFKGYKYVITEHSSAYTSEDGRYGTSPPHVRVLTKLIFRNAESISAPSQYLLNALRGRGLTRDATFVVPNVVDIPEQIESKLRHVSPVKVLTVSTLTDRDKNISGLVRAFAIVSDEEENIELHIVGDGPDRDQLENLAKQVGKLNKTILFHGLVCPEELRKFYLDASYFVLNSNYETFSVATAEALTYGLPVVVTKCGGPQEYVSDKQGILIEKEDEEELVDALRLMSKTWQGYNRLSIQEYARELFNSDRAGKILHAYLQAVDVRENRDD